VEDIPALVGHFTTLFSRRMNKRIAVIPPDVMDAMTRYPWPGNIRELENFIERCVILSCGAALDAPLQELMGMQEGTLANPVTLRDAERAHIVRILREANGVIATAATRLGLPRSTLFYKMRRLGISAGRPVKQQAQGEARSGAAS
jgi:formate hydrogenlyase transcriptional activator